MGEVFYVSRDLKKVGNEPCKFLMQKNQKLREQEVQRFKYPSVLGTCCPSSGDLINKYKNLINLVKAIEIIDIYIIYLVTIKGLKQ